MGGGLFSYHVIMPGKRFTGYALSEETGALELREVL